MNPIKYKTEKEQLAAVREDGLNIKYIYNPSEKIQLEAVREDEDAIMYIEHPTEKVQLESVKRSSLSTHQATIQYIKEPSEAVQLAAIKQNPFAIQFIHNPSDKVIRYIIESCHDFDVIIQSMRIDFSKLPDDLKLLLEVQ